MESYAEVLKKVKKVKKGVESQSQMKVSEMKADEKTKSEDEKCELLFCTHISELSTSLLTTFLKKCTKFSYIAGCFKCAMWTLFAITARQRQTDRQTHGI